MPIAFRKINSVSALLKTGMNGRAANARASPMMKIPARYRVTEVTGDFHITASFQYESADDVRDDTKADDDDNDPTASASASEEVR